MIVPSSIFYNAFDIHEGQWRDESEAAGETA